MNGVFDIGDSRMFFESIKRRYRAYLVGKVRLTEDLLYVVMGLNHLREWIAPQFKARRDGTWPACKTVNQQFSKSVYELPEFTVLRHLANATKHARDISTEYSGGAFFDGWPDVDRVADFDKGPPTAHLIDGRLVNEVIEHVIKQYEDWFSGEYVRRHCAN